MKATSEEPESRRNELRRSTDARSGLELTRRLSVAAGVMALLLLAFFPEGTLAERLSVMAVAALAFATATGWLQLLISRRPRPLRGSQVKDRSSRWWPYVIIAVVIFAGLAVQTWFRAGTTIAGGDVVVPDGTAWIARLFEPWIWGGSTLGEPSQLPLALPWAAILGLVHVFGGDPEVGQRVWYTTLFVAAGLGALGLFASLRMSPVAALIGTAVYLLNPYVITWVNTASNYIAALFLLAAIPAALIAAGTGRLSVRWSAMLIAAAAPLLGYAFLNPPLVGMIFAAALASPLLVAWVDGRDAGFRSLRAFLFAIPLLLVASAYWMFPALLHLASIVPSHLVGLSWTWSEARASIRNAIWLNTHWGWPYPEYFPYAGAFDQPPLSLLRFVLPALAFGGLALAPFTQGEEQHRRDRKLRLAVAAATVAVIFIVFSTGTNPPGNTIFLPLYNLPFGWLLREPGRFLMMVALAYAVLTGLIVEALLDHRSLGEFIESRHLAVPPLRLSIVPVALMTPLLLGVPLYTGGFVPDSGPTLATWAISARPTHVQMPAYWTEMAHFADTLPVQGNLLVMPPDDWYEMPYSWYYGTDDFVAELFKRRVILPNTQEYTPASSELVGAVNLAGQSILDRDWRQAKELVSTLNAPLILVRRDIVAPFQNHSILPPSALSEALHAAPDFVLVRQIGSLDLFALRGTVAETEVASNFMTIDTEAPDLRLLPLLPPNTALVSGEARPGVGDVSQAPPLEQWPAEANTMFWQPPLATDRSYWMAELDGKTLIPLDRARTFMDPSSGARLVYASDSLRKTVTISLTGRTAITNGDFSHGYWGTVGDCHDVLQAQAKTNLSHSVLTHGAPGGMPALRLSASLDSACEHQTLDWHGGPLVLSLMMHSLQGAPPRVCLWETGPDRCASLPAVREGTGWSTYHASVSPDAGTTALTLHLYADAYVIGGRTVNEYANVQVVEVPALPELALIGDQPRLSGSGLQLVVLHDSFSTNWRGSKGQHVLVDGMLNGWLMSTEPRVFSAHYEPAGAFRAAGWMSLATLVVILAFPAVGWIARTGGRRLRKRLPSHSASDEKVEEEVARGGRGKR